MLLSQLKTGAAVGPLADRARRAGLGRRDSGQDKAGSGQTPRIQKPRSTPRLARFKQRPRNQPIPAKPSRIEGGSSTRTGVRSPGLHCIWSLTGSRHLGQSPVRATSGPDGRFRFAVPKSDFDTLYFDTPWKGMRAPVLRGPLGTHSGWRTIETMPRS